ncbi:hypothetical protein ACQX14_11865 [Corynebacterium diphtheriae]
MDEKFSLHTDPQTWTGTLKELRDVFVGMIPEEPDRAKLAEIAAVALNCEVLDLIFTAPGDAPIYE